MGRGGGGASRPRRGPRREGGGSAGLAELSGTARGREPAEGAGRSLRVYYAILKGDTVQAKDALRVLNDVSADLLDDIMEEGAQVLIVGSYDGEKRGDENARQVAAAMKRTHDAMEYLIRKLDESEPFTQPSSRPRQMHTRAFARSRGR